MFSCDNRSNNLDFSIHWIRYIWKMHWKREGSLIAENREDIILDENWALILRWLLGRNWWVGWPWSLMASQLHPWALHVDIARLEYNESLTSNEVPVDSCKQNTWTSHNINHRTDRCGLVWRGSNRSHSWDGVRYEAGSMINVHIVSSHPLNLLSSRKVSAGLK